MKEDKLDLSGKGVKAVCTQMYTYKGCCWLSIERKLDFLILSKNIKIKQVDLFLAALFEYNGIDFGKTPYIGFENLLYQIDTNGLILGGGILFFEKNQKLILPSCCCGLECWNEIPKAVINKESPWMGHDPFPVFEFLSNEVVVWSDDCLGIYLNKKLKSELYYIKYERKELINKLKIVEEELREFICIPLYNRIKQLEATLADLFIEKMLEWLHLSA